MAMVAVPHELHWYGVQTPGQVNFDGQYDAMSFQKELPHLLTAPSAYDSREGDSSSKASEDEKPNARRKQKPQSLGRIPMAPGRISNPGLGWFNKQSCDQLQQQLQSDGVSSAIETLTGHVWDLSRHPLGCRLIQLAIERGSQKEAKALANELRGHVVEAMTSPHANYVLQKIVTQLIWQTCGFVASELQDSASHLGRHRFGCRIFCRLIEFHAEQEATQALVEEVLLEAEDLCCHPFGHHVAQSILEHGCEKHRDAVASTIEINPLGFARNQNASYLVERVLTSCSDAHQQLLLSELSSSLVDLAVSRFGCYVARAVVEHPKSNKSSEIGKLLAVQGELNKTKHGQYLLADLGLSRKPNSRKATRQM